jgi:pimeloyl-ACP methyl ester carboxylesterase
MWEQLSKAVGSALNALHLRRHPEVFEPEFYEGRADCDTVVFVHGLHGHFRTTWARFPELLRGDPDLPRLDICLWSYRASILPGAHSIKVEAQHLMTGLRVLEDSVRHVFLVGHSMGGLLILEGLCHELREGRARARPADLVRHITLYATPVLGSQLASLFLLGLSWTRRARYFLSRQLKELHQGDFCNTLLQEVGNRLYNPNIEPGSENSKRRIPITACVATDDLAVTPDSAAAIFQNPPVLRLPGGHSSIKEPRSRSDQRYKTLKAMLSEYYARWFSEQAVAARDPALGRWARLELEERCRDALTIRLRAQTALGFDALDPAAQRAMLRDYLTVAIELATQRPNMDFGDVLNLSLRGYLEDRG